MTMLEWAEREVQLAKQKEQEGCEDSASLQYAFGCYDSALKALRSLAEDGHSGMSMDLTKGILNRLIDGVPLFPLEDNEEDWKEWDILDANDDHVKKFTHRRCDNLMKYVYQNGEVRFIDTDRVRGQTPDSSTYFSNGLITRIVHLIYPIQFPYTPGERYIVDCEEYLTDPKHGDFDLVHLHGVREPNGNYHVLHIFYYLGDEDEILLPIGEYDFLRLRDKAMKLKEKM